MNRKSAVTAIAGFAAFLFISYFVITKDTLVFDTVIREFIYSLRSEALTRILTPITYIGNKQTITVICILLLLIPAVRFSFGVPASAAALLAVWIQYALKVSFHRTRPDLSLHLINQGGYSFPSGHSFSAFIFYCMLIYLCRQNMKNKTAANVMTAVLVCLVILIGFSRVYLGVHFPTDVLGGWSISLCFLMIFTSAHQYYSKSRLERT